jgi:hypothetical protein
MCGAERVGGAKVPVETQGDASLMDAAAEAMDAVAPVETLGVALLDPRRPRRGTYARWRGEARVQGSPREDEEGQWCSCSILARGSWRWSTRATWEIKEIDVS